MEVGEGGGFGGWAVDASKEVGAAVKEEIKGDDIVPRGGIGGDLDVVEFGKMAVECAVGAPEHVVDDFELGDEDPSTQRNHHLQKKKKVHNQRHEVQKSKGF